MLGIIVVGVLTGYITGNVLLKNYSPKISNSEVIPAKTNEVQVTYVGAAQNWRIHHDIFIIKDNKTQRKFIAVSGVGIAEDSD